MVISPVFLHSTADYWKVCVTKQSKLKGPSTSFRDISTAGAGLVYSLQVMSIWWMLPPPMPLNLLLAYVSQAPCSRCPYNGLLLQDCPLQVSLLPELCSDRQRHLDSESKCFLSQKGICLSCLVNSWAENQAAVLGFQIWVKTQMMLNAQWHKTEKSRMWSHLCNWNQFELFCVR